MVLPLWISALVSGLPFAFKAVTMSDWSWAVAQQWWQTKILLSTAALMIIMNSFCGEDLLAKSIEAPYALASLV
jgi:hypothetical protein